MFYHSYLKIMMRTVRWTMSRIATMATMRSKGSSVLVLLNHTFDLPYSSHLFVPVPGADLHLSTLATFAL